MSVKLVKVSLNLTDCPHLLTEHLMHKVWQTKRETFSWRQKSESDWLTNYRCSSSLVQGIETLRHQVFCLRPLVELKIDVCMFTDGIQEKYYFPSLSKKPLDSQVIPFCTLVCYCCNMYRSLNRRFEKKKTVIGYFTSPSNYLFLN